MTAYRSGFMMLLAMEAIPDAGPSSISEASSL